MKDLKLSYEEIQKLVNHLSEEEFNLLREAIYERLLEDAYEEKNDDVVTSYQKRK